MTVRSLIRANGPARHPQVGNTMRLFGPEDRRPYGRTLSAAPDTAPEALLEATADASDASENFDGCDGSGRGASSAVAAVEGRAVAGASVGSARRLGSSGL